MQTNHLVALVVIDAVHPVFNRLGNYDSVGRGK